MSDERIEYTSEFIKRFSQSKTFKKQQECFTGIFGKAHWLLFSSSDKKILVDQLKKIASLKGKGTLCLSAKCKRILRENVINAEKTKLLQLSVHDGYYQAYLPLCRGDNVYGFLVLANIEQAPDKSMLCILQNFTNSIIEEINKEIELSKLYEVIRPRAVALSTIHTVHRLIASTLDIKELLPRIARLALQVLRAEHIELYMRHEKPDSVKCCAAIDYTESKDYFKISSKCNNIAKKVFSDARSILKKDLLAVPLIEGEDVTGVMVTRDRIDKKSFTIFDQEILNTLAEQSVIAIKNAKLYKEQEDITIGSIKSLASLLDLKLPGAYTHSNLFIELILALGRQLNLPYQAMRDLHYSALLPDVGKVFVPEKILKKTTALDKKELSVVKNHTKKAVEIVRHLSGLKSCIPIILYHHEWYDGTGYPVRLKGDKIPLGARIMAVGDAFEAMMRKRPHKKRYTLIKAVREIKAQASTQFDPKVVSAFMVLYNNGKLAELLKGYKHELKKVF